VRTVLTKLRIWDPGMTITDGSGLSRATKVPADSMVKMLRLAAGKQPPRAACGNYRLVRCRCRGQPAAPVLDQSLAGRGAVRGETGTINKVRAGAGVVRTSDGSLVAYAFLINKPMNEHNAMIWLDQMTAALNTCGCR